MSDGNKKDTGGVSEVSSETSPKPSAPPLEEEPLENKQFDSDDEEIPTSSFSRKEMKKKLKERKKEFKKNLKEARKKTKNIDFLTKDVIFPSDYEKEDINYKLTNEFTIKFTKNYMVRSSTSWVTGTHVNLENDTKRIKTFKNLKNKNKNSLKNIYFYGKYGKRNRGGTIGVYDSHSTEVEEKFQTFLNLIITKSKLVNF